MNRKKFIILIFLILVINLVIVNYKSFLISKEMMKNNAMSIINVNETIKSESGKVKIQKVAIYDGEVEIVGSVSKPTGSLFKSDLHDISVDINMLSSNDELVPYSINKEPKAGFGDLSFSMKYKLNHEFQDMKVKVNEINKSKPKNNIVTIKKADSII